MRSERRGVVAVLLVAVLAALTALTACSGGDASAAVALDGSPRVPDDEGIVTSVGQDSIVLDSERRYELSGDVVAFSAIDLSSQRVANALHQYAQVGLDGDEVTWIGTVARPVLAEPPVVVYVGEVGAVGGDRLTFANGAVFAIAPDVEVEPGEVVRVTIDPDSHTVTEVSR